MSAARHSPKSNGLLIGAVVLIVFGLGSVATYVVGALPVLGQPDASLVFWLLPFLLFGLSAAGVGAVLVVLWLLLINTERPTSEGARKAEPPSRPD